MEDRQALSRGALGAVLALVLLGVWAAAARAVTLPPGFQDEVVLELDDPGIEQPTNFEFAPDGRTFVALQGGKIVVFPKGATSATKPQIFANLAKEVYDNGDHGLLGLALDPKFDEGSPYVYALYTFNHELGKAAGEEMPKWPSAGSGASAYEGDSCPEENRCLVSGRLVRLTAEGNQAKPSAAAPEEKVLLEDWCQQSTTHSIGDLAFGPEGALFVSGGEGAGFTVPDYGQFENLCGDPNGSKGTSIALNPGAEGGSLRAQSLLRPNGQVSLDGTLLRIDPATGEGWPGNSFAGDANANKRRIIGVGFRNPFRFTLSPRLGALFVNNVGNTEDEEIDRIPLDSGIYNSGWPCYEGLSHNYQFEVLNLNACNRLYEAPGSTQSPFFYYAHTSPVAPGDTCPSYHGSAISGSVFNEGSAYPAEYKDALFFADAVRGCIYTMAADEDGEPDPLSVEPFLSDATNYPGVDLEQGPEGSIYYDSLYEGTIDRIGYDPGAPAARLRTVGNPYGPVPLEVEFDAGGSTGPSGDALSYEWDLDGDGEFDDGSEEPVQKVKYENGSQNVAVAVLVEDLETGKSSVASLTVYPGDTPPKVTISAPSPSLTWSVGQQLRFAGSARAQGGKGAVLPASELYWKTRLLHCPFGPTDCHEHPIQIFPGVAEGNVGAPDHDFPSYVNFLLTATDERGLSAEAELKVSARPVSLRLRSQPSGIALVAGTKTLPTPFELLAVEDSPTTIVAPERATVGGVEYAFSGWSDGGARAHTIPASGPGTFTASYTALSRPPAPVGQQAKSAPTTPAPRSTRSEHPPGPPKIEKQPGKRSTSTSASFVFSGEPRARFHCAIDGKGFSSCRSPRTYERLRPGRHRFRVYAVDSNGNRSKTTIFKWKIVKPS